MQQTRPTVAISTATRADLEATAREVFDVIRDGEVKVEARHTCPLADAEPPDEPPARRSRLGQDRD